MKKPCGSRSKAWRNSEGSTPRQWRSKSRTRNSCRAELRERVETQEEHALAKTCAGPEVLGWQQGAGNRPEDPPRCHLPNSAARRPSSVVSRKSIHKPPPTRSPRESPVRRRAWLKRKLGM
ncbi:hypothetical protein AAFF_G00063190 [Aldrovandia affinis]|uniref:Uncharacterized protein n=1 Tax=Aldrovandia affinis TaxID=143900 RepID=A0AAD7RZU3_9TELE|nr:hypothetical protein AAFF_G00063190 [Aldrovandia affinis]